MVRLSLALAMLLVTMACQDDSQKAVDNATKAAKTGAGAAQAAMAADTAKRTVEVAKDSKKDSGW